MHCVTILPVVKMFRDVLRLLRLCGADTDIG
jgi:hypothetical protein